MALSGSMTTGYWTSSDSGQTRGYTLEWTATQSIANNQSTISWALKTAGTYPYTVAERTLIATLAGVTLVSKTDRVMRGAGTVTSGSFTVSHDSSGNCSISGSIQAAVYTSSVNCTASESWSLDTIPRKANVTSANSVTDEENPYFTFSNPGGFDMYAELEVNPNNTHLFKRNVPNTGSFTFELTDEERDTLRGYLTEANSGTLRYLLYSNNGGWVSYVDRTLTIVNAKPTVEPTVKDVNSKTLAITNDENVFIRYHSNAEVSVNAKAYKNASITASKVICGGQNISTDTGVIQGIDSGNFVFSATDSRGNTVSDSKQVTFIEYVKLTCDLQAKAPTTEGDLTFSILGNYYNNAFGTTDNQLLIECCYSEGGGEFTEWQAVDGFSVNGNRYSVTVTIPGLDYRSSYVVKARATDLLSEVVTESKSLRAIPVCDWGENDFNFNVPVTIQGIKVLEKMKNMEWKPCTVTANEDAGYFYKDSGKAWYRYGDTFLDVRFDGSYVTSANINEYTVFCTVSDLEIAIPEGISIPIWDDSGQNWFRVELNKSGEISLSSNASIPANHWIGFQGILFNFLLDKEE